MSLYRTVTWHAGLSIFTRMAFFMVLVQQVREQ